MSGDFERLNHKTKEKMAVSDQVYWAGPLLWRAGVVGAQFVYLLFIYLLGVLILEPKI